jgi:capsular polysaccharide transport system ATP-binding protein
MITLDHVTKRYVARSGVVTVLDDITLQVKPGEKVGILGGNGAGKSTLIRLIGGAEQPTSGSIKRDMSVSWPLAFGGAFQTSLTGMDNLRCICRIYGVPIDGISGFVRDFAELGKYFDEPLRTYSSGMRSRLAFALSLAVEFDCFLIDEIVAVGDDRFSEKCKYELFEKRRDRAMIIASHQSTYIKAHCDSAAVMDRGRLHRFERVDEAFDFYTESQRQREVA